MVKMYCETAIVRSVYAELANISWQILQKHYIIGFLKPNMNLMIAGISIF
jgi:hypothetical protein